MTNEETLRLLRAYQMLEGEQALLPMEKNLLIQRMARGAALAMAASLLVVLVWWVASNGPAEIQVAMRPRATARSADDQVRSVEIRSEADGWASVVIVAPGKAATLADGCQDKWLDEKTSEKADLRVAPGDLVLLIVTLDKNARDLRRVMQELDKADVEPEAMRKKIAARLGELGHQRVGSTVLWMDGGK